MAPRNRNKQDELNRTYRAADVGRVGASLRNQGFSQNNKGDTFYTVGGVKYNAATGRPVKPRNRPASAPAPQPPTRNSGGGGGGGSRSSGGGGGGGSSAAPASAPSPRSAIHTYREHGSDLHVGRYKTLAEHRAAVEKAKGGGSSTSSTPSSSNPSQERLGDKAPNGKEYAGPGGGGGSPNPDIRNSRSGTDWGGAGGGNQVPYRKPDAETKVEKKPQRRLSAGDQRYMSEWEKRRKGQSNVIG
jgi:hypothetical protein